MPTLLMAQGSGWTIEIVGKLPELPPFVSTAPESFVAFVGAAEVQVFDAKAGNLRSVDSLTPWEPLFFESVSYDVHFERADASTKIALPTGAELRRERQYNEHYTLNFGNNVGFADFVVSSSSGTASLRIEVFPRKVDYRTDYVAMRDEISGTLRNLAMGANSRTFGLAAPAYDHRPTLVEWFALVEAHFKEFHKLATAIVRNPHTGLVQSTKLVATDRARSVDQHALARALRSGNNGALLPGHGITLPRRVAESVSVTSFDTAENRYFKALLRESYRNIRALSRASCSGDEDANYIFETKFFTAIRSRLAAMERKVESLLRAPMLSQVSDALPTRPNSMVLHKNTLYSRFDKLARMFNGGLSFSGNIVPIGLKETALLYEYWCFLKIVDLLRQRFDLVEQTVVTIKRTKLTVTLKKGQESAMRFVHKSTGAEVFLVYNRLFSRLPTLGQAPDNVIQFASASRYYIFDAKYRLQFDTDYQRVYGGPGPTTDDINTMHRYRDAIAIPHPMKPGAWEKGVVIGAVALFPYPDEANYQQHRFFKSIGQVEIGGLPFLPGATSLVASKLQEILKDQYPELKVAPPASSAIGPNEAQ